MVSGLVIIPPANSAPVVPVPVIIHPRVLCAGMVLFPLHAATCLLTLAEYTSTCTWTIK
jgi:hypothetical protein